VFKYSNTATERVPILLNYYVMHYWQVAGHEKDKRSLH